MVLGKRKRSYGKRKRSFRKRRRVYRRRRTPRTVFLKTIPDRLFCTLKYNDRIKLSQGSTGLVALHAFALNSLHDPDYSGTGHQPLYYDQLVNTAEGNGLYLKYRVHSCSYVLRFVNSDTNTEHSVTVVPLTHGNAVQTNVDFDAVCEAPYAQRRTLGINSAGNNSAIVKGSMMIKKIEGVSSLDISPSYQAVYGNSPGFVPTLWLVASPMSENTTIGAIYVDVTLYYKCELFDRIYRSATN